MERKRAMEGCSLGILGSVDEAKAIWWVWVLETFNALVLP